MIRGSGRPRRRGRLSAAVATVIAIAGAATAEAHPVDEVAQTAYLFLAPDLLRLELDITPGTEVADMMVGAIDSDADGTFSDAEVLAYAAAVLAQSELTLDGVPASWTVERTVMPAVAALVLGDVIRIYAVSERPDAAGSHVLVYENRYEPTKSQRTANIFLQPGEGWSYAVGGQDRSPDGASLTVRYTTAR